MEGQGAGPCGRTGWKLPPPPAPSPHLGLSRGLGGRRALACSPPSPQRTTRPILSLGLGRAVLGGRRMGPRAISAPRWEKTMGFAL